MPFSKLRHICLIAVAIISLCSCFATKKSQTVSHPAATDNNLTFINDISMEHDGRTTAHRSKKYNSPPIKVPVEKSVSISEKYAQILDVPVNNISNISLYNFIDDWWGVPYKFGGETKDGIDCSAFVKELYSDVYHINLARNSLALFHQVTVLHHKKNLKEGDLVFFRTTRKRRVTHVGVYLQNNKFVQASTSQGVTISDLNDPYWLKHYAGAGRVKTQ